MAHDKTDKNTGTGKERKELSRSQRKNGRRNIQIRKEDIDGNTFQFGLATGRTDHHLRPMAWVGTFLQHVLMAPRAACRKV